MDKAMARGGGPAVARNLNLLRGRFQYRFDNLMARGTPAMIGLLGAGAALLIGVGGLLLVLLPPAPGGRPAEPPAALWTSLLHALDPGSVGGDGGSPAFRGLAMAITLGGILILSALIGVVTAGIDAKLARLRKGRSVVVERGHTVVIGWSEQIFTIVSELVEANRSAPRGCITVLAARDKMEMDDALRERLGRTPGTRVVCRSGNPVDPADLALVCPRSAKSIIVLPPPDEDADAQVIKVLLALSLQLRDPPVRQPNGRGEGRPRNGTSHHPHVVATITDRRNLAAARLAGGPHASLVDAGDFTSRVMVQTSLQSGLSSVYSELLDFAGDEIYLHDQPELAGQTFGQALSAYRTCAVMGVLTAAKHVLLNPPMSRRVEKGEQLILIAEDDDAIKLAPDPLEPPEIDESAISLIRRRAPAGTSVLMLGWNASATPMVEQLDAYVPVGSRLQVVSDHSRAAFDIALLKDRIRALEIDLKEADPARRETLESINLTRYDHLIVLCSDEMEAQHADSRTLVTLLHVRDISAREAHSFTLVTELTDDRNRALARVVHPDDFIVSEKLTTLRMTQVSENRHLETVFNDLFDPAGSEIYLKPAGEYVLPGVPVNFYTVIEAARRRGETAIGYRLLVDTMTQPMHGVTLNPDKEDVVTLAGGDKVIVLAES